MKMVSVIVPVRNEEAHVRACLQSLLAQNYPDTDYEIIVVDGRSSDLTLEIVKEFCRQSPRVRNLDNPAGIVPVSMNIGIRAASGEVIVRADGHATYPPNYISDCVRYLESTGA